jgi:CRP-like cAMP-binding protein
VIRSGTVSVTTTELGEIRRLGANDWFGEIGLLRGVPRTATITAVEATELLVTPGRVFLDAVTAQEALPDTLAATLSIRLARTHPHLAEPAAP